MTSAPVPNDHDLARDLATRTGELLAGLRPTLVDAEPAVRKATADRAAQDFLAEQLALHRPQDCVLSEEADDDERRLTADRVWVIDPLDGTREYAMDGRVDWAVHVALWERSGDGGAVTAAAVALPAQGVTLGTDPAPVVPARPDADGPLRVVRSASRPPVALDVVAAEFDVVAVPVGSAGAKTAEVVLGRADVYLHDPGLNQWDVAAPVGVALAAGLHASHLDGSPIRFNGPDTVSGDILICRPELAAPLLGVLAAARSADPA